MTRGLKNKEFNNTVNNELFNVFLSISELKCIKVKKEYKKRTSKLKKAYYKYYVGNKVYLIDMNEEDIKLSNFNKVCKVIEDFNSNITEINAKDKDVEYKKITENGNGLDSTIFTSFAPRFKIEGNFMISQGTLHTSNYYNY